MNFELIFSWGLLVGGLMFCLYAACSETGFTNVSMSRILKNENQDKRWTMVKTLKDNPDQLFSTILVVQTIGNVLVASFGAKLMVFYGLFSSKSHLHAFFMTIIVGVGAFLFLELIPKMYGTYHFERVLMRIVPSLSRLTRFLRIPLMPLVAIPRILTGKGGGDVFHHASLVSEEDLIQMMELGSREGSIHQEEVRVLRNIFDSSEVEAEDIMVPRINMKSVDGKVDLTEAISIFRNHGVSRLPVFEESVDNMVGVLYAKDLLRTKSLDMNKPVRSYMRKGIYLIPETKKVLELFSEFRNRNLQLAVVVDEYGGTVGLLTLEDVMEEIVGEIFDEHDVVKPLFMKLPSGEIRYQANFPLESFAQECSLVVKDDLEDYETLGGWLSGKIGHVPSAGEEYREGPYRFIVESVSKQRIQRLLLIREKT